GFVVASMKARVGKARPLRIRPAWPDGIHKRLCADDAGMGLVGSVERDPTPIHKLVAAPGRGHAHRVVVVKHPGAALRDAARAVVEANGDAFVSDVVRLDLQRPEERRTEIHAQILWTFLELDHGDGL